MFITFAGDLLARKPHSPKELQTHTSPVLHEKVDSLHRCKSSAQSDQITESDDKSLACKGRVCGKHEELDSNDRKCLCERKLQHDRFLETLSDAPSVPQIPPPANRKQEPHESVPSSRVSIVSKKTLASGILLNSQYHTAFHRIEGGSQACTQIGS